MFISHLSRVSFEVLTSYLICIFQIKSIIFTLLFHHTKCNLRLQERPGPAAAAYRAIMEGRLGLRDPRPVFVVGMARSGSTLVEQILASHPQGFGAGRIQIFPFCPSTVRSRGG